MILLIETHFYSLIYRKGVSGCFITNGVMVVLVQLMSTIMPGIVRTKSSAKFIRKYIQHLCMAIEVKSKVKQPDVNSSDQLKVNINCAAANAKSDVISMYVVPMFARLKLPNCIAKTYAMLVIQCMQCVCS